MADLTLAQQHAAAVIAFEVLRSAYDAVAGVLLDIDRAAAEKLLAGLHQQALTQLEGGIASDARDEAGRQTLAAARDQLLPGLRNALAIRG